MTTANAVYCWGYNGNGELGDGTIVAHATPQPVIHPVAQPLAGSGY